MLATEMQVKLTEGEQARLRYTTTNNVEAWTYWAQGCPTSANRSPRQKSALRSFAGKKPLRSIRPRPRSMRCSASCIVSTPASAGGTTARQPLPRRGLRRRALELDPEQCRRAHGVRHGPVITAKGTLMRPWPMPEERSTCARFGRRGEPCSFSRVRRIPRRSGVQSKKAMALNPNYPPYVFGEFGYAHRLAGQVEEAISAFKAYDAHLPGSGFGLADLVILYQQNGRSDEAKQIAERLLSARPDFTIASWLKTQIIRDAARLEADVAALSRRRTSNELIIGSAPADFRCWPCVTSIAGPYGDTQLYER